MLTYKRQNLYFKFRAAHGMTVVEVVVAMVIAAVVVFIIYGAMDTTFRLGKRGLAEIERLEEARLAMDYITRDLSGAVALAKDNNNHVLFQGRKGDAVGLDNDSLLLVVGKSLPEQKGKTSITFQEVLYAVQTTNRGKDFESRIYRYEDDMIDGQVNTTKNVHGLGIGLPNVKYGLRLRYWDTQLPTGPGWVEEWMNRPGLPKQVMVIITVQHPKEQDGTFQLQTVVRLMAS
ncbi:MAG: hypothetical protein N3A72_05325 [bacterium]|nr:hypothetical protein [bacterium]